MAFLTNTTSTILNPYTSLDRYMILAHPDVTDTLLLNEFGSGGDGYKPSQVAGVLTVTERTLLSIVAAQATYKKLQWPDLAFVMSAAQAKLFDQLVLAQTPAMPITLSDRVADPAAPVNKLVIIESPNGKQFFGNLGQYIVQFSATEV